MPADVRGTMHNPHAYPAYWSSMGINGSPLTTNQNCGKQYAAAHYGAGGSRQRSHGPLWDETVYCATMPAGAKPLKHVPAKRCSRAGKSACTAHPVIPPPEASKIIPLGTLKEVLREKMRNIMSEDREQLRKVWWEFDTRRLGYITLKEFEAMMTKMNISLDRSSTEHFMKRLSKGNEILPFEDFFHRVLGVDRELLLGKNTTVKVNTRCVIIHIVTHP